MGSDDGWTKERESVNKIRMIVKGEDRWRRGKERRLEIRVNEIEERGDWRLIVLSKKFDMDFCEGFLIRIIINNEEVIWEGRKRIKILFDLKT